MLLMKFKTRIYGMEIFNSKFILFRAEFGERTMYADHTPTLRGREP